jgi:hypothetical protein
MGAAKLMTAAGGGVILDAASTATDKTITVPARTGNMAVDGPAFSAYNSTGQTITTATWTKATFDTEEFDTSSNFASSRFTPTVAGYYQFNYEVDVYGGGNNVYGVPALYKNGAAVKRGSGPIVTGNQVEVYLTLNALVYLNGSTDYVEIYVNITSTGTIQLFGGSPVVGFFQGFLARAA